jgi:hypothetical protein
VASLKFAADECLFYGKHQLVEDGFAWLQAQPEECHSCTVTQVNVLVKMSCKSHIWAEIRRQYGVDPLLETARNRDSWGWLLGALQQQG